jgi:hypothetical protein
LARGSIVAGADVAHAAVADIETFDDNEANRDVRHAVRINQRLLLGALFRGDNRMSGVAPKADIRSAALMSQNDPRQTFGGSLWGDYCTIIIRGNQTNVALRPTEAL